MPENNRSDVMRHEIIQLLHAQLDALADASCLTDDQLEACYKRQERVRELRDELSATSDWKSQDPTLSGRSTLSENTETVASL